MTVKGVGDGDDGDDDDDDDDDVRNVPVVRALPCPVLGTPTATYVHSERWLFGVRRMQNSWLAEKPQLQRQSESFRPKRPPRPQCATFTHAHTYPTTRLASPMSHIRPFRPTLISTKRSKRRTRALHAQTCNGTPPIANQRWAGRADRLT
jgi:hypothetical protein